MKKNPTIVFQRIFLVGAILCTLFIWGNSLLTADSSMVQSNRVEQVVDPVMDSMKIPEATRPHLVREWAHTVEFFLLGLCWMGVFKFRKGYFPLGLCLLTAAADELIQIPVPGRGPEWKDLGQDMLGAVAAILLLTIFAFVIRLVKKKSYNYHV